VHVLLNGRIVTSVTIELALELEEKGYAFIKDEMSLTATV
jgi:Fe-S cluster assembly ATP-binding protein